jgi:acyl-CoA synthetase (AMP-forming)/AMP-acid ligase II
VTALTAVPTMIAMMLRETAALAAADLSAVKIVRVGSAPVSEALAADVHAVFPQAVLTNGYGTTEAGPVVFAPDPAGPPTSVGRAHPEVSLRLMLDGVEVEGPGEGVMEMRCPALMNGYHGLPEATAKAMTPDGYYRTGDVFIRDEAGFFSFVGRADDMFNSAGENIYPSEVEAVMARHPAVQQVVVVPLPDELKGAKPVAFVVPRPGMAVNEAELKQFVLANAPPYHHPRRVWFVDALPLAGTNKIDRRALIERAVQEGGLQ